MRAYPRVAQTHLAYLLTLDGRGRHGRSIDLGVRGVGLELSDPVEQNAPCNISLSLGGEIVELAARVVRCRPLGEGYDVGCALAAPSRAYLRALGQLFADAMS